MDSNVLKSAWNTFLQAFVPLFLLALSGWLADLLDWVSNLGEGGEAVVAFPDPSVLIKAVAAALISAIIGAVAAIHTAIRNKSTVLGDAPVYVSTPTNP